MTLSPGQIFRFTDQFEGDPAPLGLPRRLDGQAQVLLGDARQPVLCADPPRSFRQKLVLPREARLWLAYGPSPGGKATRFIVKARQGGRTTQLLSREVERWAGGGSDNWKPQEFALPAGEVEIELITEYVRPPDTEQKGKSCALWANPMVVVPDTTPRPNLVLLHLDALRPDHLGSYGYRRETSPYLDRIAARGVVFEEAMATATWTYPSTQGFLTSTYPSLSFGSEVGEALTERGRGARIPGPAITGASLQGQLQAAGYETLACTGGGYLDPRFGFDLGFDWYWSANYPMLPDQLRALKERLSERRGEPFFLFLQTYEIHHYRKGYGHGLSRYDRGYQGRLRDKLLLEEAVSGRLKDLRAADRQYLLDLYDGEVRHTDGLLEEFLEWLFAQPWGRNTVVAVTADHGESFGEHGQMGHCGVPYRELARVPLICYRHGQQWPARRVAQPVSLVDLAPTLLELGHAPVTREMVGQSLGPLLSGKPVPEKPRLCGNTEALLAREGRWWYLTWPGQREELYDSAQDPEQRRNLAPSAPQELVRMRGVLARLAAESRRGYHLWIKLPPKGALTVELKSARELSYAEAPTLGAGDSLAMSPDRRRLKVELRPGRKQHLLLFEPAAGAAVSLSAQVGGKPVEAARFHLGRRGLSPKSLPVSLTPSGQRAYLSERPPGEESGEWGLWLWLPPGAARPSQGSSHSAEMPQDLERKLRALGYLK